MNDKVSNKFELTETTSYFVFLFPLTVLVFSILYMIIQDFSQFFLFLLIIIFLFIKSFLLFYNKKIIINKKKIYVFIRDKKLLSWEIYNDLKIIDYKSSLLGKIFNYGTLTLVNNNNEIYEYYYLNNGDEVDKIIKNNHIYLLKKLDPNYISPYIESNTNNLDKLDE